MSEIEKTPTLGLNKPPAGYFEWDTPINENWDKLDFLGAGQLPLLWHIDVRHKLAGDQLAGWSLQGSELDGAVYTAIWDILWAAKQRAATQYSIQVRGKTYYFNQDAVTGLIFVNDTNYNAALSALGDSLGYIVSYIDGVKRIRLPKDSSLDLPVLDNSLPGGFVDETLPNITGRFAGGVGDGATATGAFTRVGTDTASKKVDAVGDSNAFAGLFDFSAARSNASYVAGARVQPRSHRVYRYYKTGNTIVNQQIIDVSNLLSQVNSLATEHSEIYALLNGKIPNPTGSNTSWKIPCSNGFKIMGGFLPTIDNNSYWKVSFPVAFNSIPILQTTYYSTQGNGYEDTRNVTKTGFEFWAVSHDGSYHSNSIGMSWVAVGL